MKMMKLMCKAPGSRRETRTRRELPACWWSPEAAKRIGVTMLYAFS
jgi:hypothetical protein